ncbi:aminotransferase class V-fold PLP-dependent enzyme [Stappia sp. GBMRC 2046]|uniref:Cysteine desulfurase n=1 Tax=Stappia sediminis TaxID=2692190 RepID=A0A7X3LSZ6_9HYPH|nr:cysteine desulfurase family protein [Stappia sediminis]MXN64538.1 aminotransferase class V-fold PLP-dependent enzyme [Stappia sediminis]
MSTGGDHIYLDYNASAPLRPAVRDLMVEVLARAGNASSVHGAGRSARGHIETAREQVGALAGVPARNVMFTSGGTEANVTGLSPAWLFEGNPLHLDRVFVSATEHPSVLSGGRFDKKMVEQIPVAPDGVVDVDFLEERTKAALSEGERVLVSVMAANSETGVINPVAEIGRRIADTGAVYHVDAVQAAGRMPLDVSRWKADAVSLSAHKLGGPQGAGALVLGAEDMRPVALLTGGAQENRRRAGTENVAAIAGFGKAAELIAASAEEWAEISRLRAFMEEGLRHIWADTVVFGIGAERLCNTTCFAVPGVTSEMALIGLDLDGIAISSGSACSSGKVSVSHVLTAMGVEEDVARCALRASIGWATKRQDIERFLEVWEKVSGRIRPGKAGAAA